MGALRLLVDYIAVTGPQHASTQPPITPALLHVVGDFIHTVWWRGYRVLGSNSLDANLSSTTNHYDFAQIISSLTPWAPYL